MNDFAIQESNLIFRGPIYRAGKFLRLSDSIGCVCREVTNEAGLLRMQKKDWQEYRGTPATLKGYMIKLNQLALITLQSIFWIPAFRDIQLNLPETP